MSVEILLATFNGAKFLEEQLISLREQTLETVHVLVSDDGSTDDTLEILTAFQSGWTKGDFRIIHGPSRGFAKNFRNLVLHSREDIDHYAFCDQDDIWLADKLERSIKECSNQDKTARVFCSRSALIDADGKSMGLAPLQKRKASFRNAVLQNIASGNTMVMNRAARNLMVQTADHIGLIPHDHWLYMIVTGAGGEFSYSPRPTLLYRQHGGNVIGIKSKPFLKRHAWRLDRYVTGEVRKRTAFCIAAMEACDQYLTEDARQVVSECKTMHYDASALARVAALARSGIYRNSFVGQIGLWLDCLFKLR